VADTTTRIDQTFFRTARAQPQAPALLDRERTVSYAELSRLIAGAAAKLREAGVGSGDKVALFLDKTFEQVAGLYAVWSLGAVVVPIYEGLKSKQVAHIVGHSASRVLVTSQRRLAGLDAAAYAGVPVVLAEWEAVDSTGIERGAAVDSFSEPAIILYTSGSTGLPKGILTSHGNLVAGTRIVSQYLDISRADRLLSVLPFSFDYGLNQLLTAMHVGGSLVLQRSHFPPDICRSLEDFAVTGMAAVPPLWIQLMSSLSPLPGMKLPHLRYITNSGGRFPVELVHEYRRHLPHVRVFLMYGLSEAFRSSYLPPEQVDRRSDSMGKASPETEILVVNDAGGICGAGEPGELVHRGPTVAMGYWRDPQTTAAVYRPDTLPGALPGATVVYSGDLVRRDAEGYLYFVGRRDHMIKAQGYRVSPEEVEETILASSLVDEVGVCGRPDAQSGAVVIAHVVPRDLAAFDSGALLRYCQREMPGYMVPREIRVRDSLPRTASGKIDRKSLES
jgi:acyl-CoA ligase (AMP-forming) (exosortase A-associated)